MAPGINLNDENAWDDSVLINSWDEALNEYKKYYSIQAQGKRLEDVLSKEELRQLTEEHGDLMEEVTEETRSAAAGQDAAGASQAEEATTLGHQGDTAETQLPPQHDGPLTASMSMPQALVGSVHDQNLKNLMMSWYYAGYYTGLHAGQQQTAANNSTQAGEGQK
ncbi:hypothetical protein K504DRAFT_458492 [Pleomassaria siparia CBS 279.74]|uniref:Survival Motor Neuron Gemin2-binding domain-containing protein n=1 Tax=Pleomassaria siparia CBS 279.74 TaxID=1314801 RepID=A0A6G1K2D3_9PLEO|nr:hypothetical protein K504DRAFT_458492 [Pleomassaria siparia CBS 279.74]